MDTIYLNVAGFVVKLIFNKINSSEFIVKFQKQILYNNTNFVLINKPKIYDFCIKFVGMDEVIIFNKNPHTYIHYFEESDTNIVTYYYISRILFLIIIRYVLDKLLYNNGFILHCSACEINDQAVIFIGKEAAGKSTITQILSSTYSTLADDTGILKKEYKTLYFYQTPFLEKNNIYNKNPRRFKINKVFFLRKANFCKVEKIEKKSKILNQMVSQVWTEKKEHIRIKLNLLSYFTTTFQSFYYLYFSKDKKKLINCLQNVK